MMTVYKFPDYKTYIINIKAITSYVPHKAIEEPFSYQYGNSSLVTPVPSGVTVDFNKLKYGNQCGSIMIDHMINKAPLGDKLYFHPNCTIPRAKATQKYTRTIKPEKADTCVIPKTNKDFYTTTAAVFINKSAGKIYYIPEKAFYINHAYVTLSPTECENCPLGTSFTDIYPMLKNSTIIERNYYTDRSQYTNENWRDFLESTLIFYGYCTCLENKETWVADLLYKKLHHVVTEDTVLATLGSSENEFNEDICASIKQMLNSSDDTIVGMGLKTLAELDYEKYRNSVVHLLCSSSTKWSRNDMRTNTSVKYMLKFLNLWCTTRERYSDTISLEDFTLLQSDVKSEFENLIKDIKEKFNSRFPFASIDVDYSFNISPKTKDLIEDNNTETNQEINNDEQGKCEY